MENVERLGGQLEATGALLGRVRANDAIREVMGRILRRASRGEALRVFTELPPELRNLLSNSLPTPKAQTERFNRDQLIVNTARALVVRDDEADTIVRAVLAVIRPLISPETAERFANQLPQDIRELWSRAGVPLTYDDEQREEADLLRMVDMVSRRLGTDEDGAWTALLQVLCVLEQRIAGGQARQMLDQLPATLRTAVFECRQVDEHPPTAFGARNFIERVEHRLGSDHATAEDAVLAVFTTLRDRLSERAARDISSELPEGLKDLWWGSPLRSRRQVILEPAEPEFQLEEEMEVEVELEPRVPLSATRPLEEQDELSADEEHFDGEPRRRTLPRALLAAALVPVLKKGIQLLERLAR